MHKSGDEHARQLSMTFNEVNTLAIACVHMHTTAEPNSVETPATACVHSGQGVP